ncbi:hypothetical protein VUJ49_22855 [Pseudomonas berkeleyensis]|uniref:Host nuclease inhibitor protein n=1 Tax=Pseudomonas berkeleyensis TaxID=2726956 RepID=A0A7G5DM32_9PSED|nr:hypothetical protein [Pseudomonas berkeleyensis]QMV62807.1 hypothetical protein HS968_22760 [Pseudomonas berkeleyensis]WSO38261.1 hypothetical protein VUJ49_22855 [Pseudomonas berkeleyensis]
MTKFYAVCDISGAIRITDEQPSEGQFALAVGEFDAVIETIAKTSDGCTVNQVPGVEPNGDTRANLGAIARYIQVLGTLEVPGFRALGA